MVNARAVLQKKGGHQAALFILCAAPHPVRNTSAAQLQQPHTDSTFGLVVVHWPFQVWDWLAQTVGQVALAFDCPHSGPALTSLQVALLATWIWLGTA